MAGSCLARVLLIVLPGFMISSRVSFLLRRVYAFRCDLAPENASRPALQTGPGLRIELVNGRFGHRLRQAIAGSGQQRQVVFQLNGTHAAAHQAASARPEDALHQLPAGMPALRGTSVFGLNLNSAGPMIR